MSTEITEVFTTFEGKLGYTVMRLHQFNSTQQAVMAMLQAAKTVSVKTENPLVGVCYNHIEEICDLAFTYPVHEDVKEKYKCAVQFGNDMDARYLR